jgi:hypothetical protein
MFHPPVKLLYGRPYYPYEKKAMANAQLLADKIAELMPDVPTPTPFTSHTDLGHICNVLVHPAFRVWEMRNMVGDTIFVAATVLDNYPDEIIRTSSLPELVESIRSATTPELFEAAERKVDEIAWRLLPHSPILPPL